MRRFFLWVFIPSAHDPERRVSLCLLSWALCRPLPFQSLLWRFSMPAMPNSQVSNLLSWNKTGPQTLGKAPSTRYRITENRYHCGPGLLLPKADSVKGATVDIRLCPTSAAPNSVSLCRPPLNISNSFCTRMPFPPPQPSRA